jgi:hypothetical protein
LCHDTDDLGQEAKFAQMQKEEETHQI